MLIENRHNCDYVVLFMINIGFLFILFQKMELKPSEICFSQAEINNVFDKRSCHPHKNLGETLDELVEGRCRISDIPTISVVWRNEKWVTTDNRRLWVFRHLEKLGKCTTIRVNQTYFIDSRKLNSTNDGRTARFYSGRSASGRWHCQVPSIAPNVPTSYQPANRTYNNNTCSVPSVFPSNQPGTTELYRRPMSSSSSMFSVPDSSEFSRLMRSLSTNRNQTELNPSDIRYTKENITITDFFQNLKANLEFNMNILTNIEPIIVYKAFGKYWVTDGNKRLWSFKGAQSRDTNLTIKVDIKEDKDEFLDVIRKDRPWLSLIDILQSGENISQTIA
jgi:hypothetical protein